MVGAERSLTDTDTANTVNTVNADNTVNAANTDNTANTVNADAANLWRINHLIQGNYNTLLPMAWSTPYHLINS